MLLFSAPFHWKMLTFHQWLLNLLSDDEPQVVTLGLRILARLITTHGSSYANKFAINAGGFIIMRHLLRIWWDVPAVWSTLIALLFGCETQSGNQQTLDLSEMERKYMHEELRITFPEVMPILISMLGAGLLALGRESDDHSVDGFGKTSQLMVKPSRERAISATQESYC